MALVLADRVNETTTTTGTGTVTLAGAVDGYQSFTVIGNGNTTYYTIVHQTLNEWEVGIGTYTASGTTLSRDTILASSNGGSAVNFSAGTKFVFCDYPAGRAVYLDSSTNVTVPQITLSGGTANGVLYLNGSKVATSGSALTFDGSDLATSGNFNAGNAKSISLNASSSGETNRLQWKYGGVAYAWIERVNSTGDMAFGTQSSQRMVLDASGNLGIGTSSPGQKLEVLGNISAIGVSSGTRYIGTLNETDTYTGALALQAGGGSAAWGGGVVMYGHSHATYPGGVWIGRSVGASGPIMFGNGGIGPSSEQMRLDYSGNLGIGTSSPAYKLDVSGTGYASSDFRAPIFYDSNNTGYYVDPSGSASFVGAGYISGTNGRLVLRDNSIENWATASDSAGIAVNYYGYNLGTAYFRDFDVYDGKNNARLNVYGSANYTQATGSLRAPLFYDSNNTGYYMDPSSSGNVQGNWEFSSTNNSSTSYSVAAIELRESNQGGSGSYLAPRLAFHWGGVVASQIGIESGGRISILDNPGSGYQDLIGNILYGSASVRAPIFYDSDNTAYYVDPTSGTSFQFVGGGYINGANNSNSYIAFNNSSTYWGIIGNYSVNDWRIGYGNAGSMTGGWNLRWDASGNAWANSSFRAPIFYDSDNTGYYVDPASTSNLWVVQLLNGKWFPENNASGNSIELYVRPNADNTYVWRHIYGGSGTGFGTGVGGYGIYAQHLGGDYSLLFNAAGYVTAPYSLRSPIFYDSNDTAYYVDPNSSTSANFYGSVNAATYNLAGLLVNASGTSSSGGAIAIQQGTAEGWTGIFCDYEPYTGWGLWHDNPNNYFSFTAELSTGSIRSFSVPSRVSGLRTAYEKFRVDQTSGDTITGAIGYANASFRAPIFYDSNDTNYYVDPASFTNLNAVNATRIGVNPSGSSSNGYGISLYGGYTAAEPTYGLMFQGTSTFGTYGSVSGDWATYFTMNNDPARGWIFRNVSTGNVAGISNAGQMTLASHLEQGNNLGRPNVSWSAGGASTGMVIFYLPGTTSNYGMVHMVFDIYEYDSPRVATVIIGGHNWATSWYNVGCNVVGYTDKQVRLGVKDGRFCVVFGTSGASWTYGTIVLRKIHNAGFYDNVMNMTGDWSSTQTTTESFTNITGDLRGLRTPSTMQVDGILYGYNSIRSNIFYDNDNTSYYLDPASTSLLYTLNIGNYIQTNAGGVKWDQSGVRSWSMYPTSGYMLLTSGDTAGSFYVTLTGGVRSPIFYDSNDTSYYLDPNSTSNLRTLVLNPGTSGVNTGLYINGGDITAARSSTTGVIYFGSNGGVYLYNDGSNYLFGPSGGYVQSNTSFRAPIFYDLDNTGYYVDPASNSLSLSSDGIVSSGAGTAGGFQNRIYVGGRNRIWSFGNADAYGISYFQGSPDYIGFHFGTATQAASQFWVNTSGTAQASADFRAPIFYDSSNTAYYVDPNSSSYLYQLTLSGAVYFRPSTWIQFDGSYGLYWPNTNGAHLEGNTLSSYGTIAIRGSRGGYGGIYDNYSAVSGLMYDGSGNGGVYREANGRWYSYYNVSNDCWGFGDSTTYSYVNAYGAKGFAAGTRMDSPIYYDSTNSAYYLRPANSDSGLMRGWLRFNDYGAGIVGSYASTRYQLVFAMGDSYKGSIDGTSLSGAYGLWWSYPSAGGPASNLSSHGLMCIVNGAFYASLDASMRAISDMRAPIFYDYNDTTYYADLNSTGTSIRAAGNIVAYYSDERLKKHLGKIENALEKVDQLEGFYYEANEVAQKLGYKVKREVGVSAQAVQRVLPEIVTDAPISANYLTIDYERLVPLLIEAIKELKGEVETLKSRLH